MFYTEFCKISKSAFFTEHLQWLLLWFILVASVVVTWVNWFSGHRFKLEAEDFIFHILQRKFPNFGVKILALSSAKSLRNFYFSLFRSQLVYTCSKYEVVQSLVKPFPKLIFFSFSIHKRHIIVQTKRQKKTIIQIFQIFLMSKAPLALIFYQGLHITRKIYCNLSIKGKNYQLD